MKRLASILCILMMVFIAMTSAPAVAETGTGTGDGSGGGSDIAFAVVQTDPQDGATGVDVKASIWLLFNKNVVNLSVRDINQANIILRDSAGHVISAEVTMKDDQVEPEYRREIVVVPSDPLNPGTTYILTIGSAVQAKNGDTLGKACTVTFTTKAKTSGGQQNGTTDPTQNQGGDGTNGDSTSGQDGDDQNPPPSDDGSGSSGHPQDNALWIALLAAGIVLLAGSATALFLMRKKSSDNNL